jgi:adenosylcobinamide-phosphate synthase
MIAALGLDCLLGEPRRFHPLVGFGRLAQAAESRFYADSRLAGALLAALLCLPAAALAFWLGRLPGGWLIDTAILYLAIGGKSLFQHAKKVRDALLANDLPAAQEAVSRIVSRDAQALDQEGVARAAIESVLENGNDALFATLFWFAVAGAPGAALQRLLNTLDAMWGYKTGRYRRFGWAAARLDDLMAWLPARLVAFSYALSGNAAVALRCWRRQAPLWDSPNAGPVMAAGAGALGVRLGGPAPYFGRMEDRPALGLGRLPKAQDIDRALRLINNSLALWAMALCIACIFFYVIRHA